MKNQPENPENQHFPYRQIKNHTKKVQKNGKKVLDSVTLVCYVLVMLRNLGINLKPTIKYPLKLRTILQ